MGEVNWILRDVDPDDAEFIVHSWRRSYESAPEFQFCDTRHYIDQMTRRITALLRDGVVVVACAEEEPSIVLGYCVVSQDRSTMHYLYVRNDFRRQGIGQALFAACCQQCRNFTHRPLGQVREPKGWRYRPFIWGPWSD